MVFNNDGILHPDSVVGIDSRTTMIDGLGVAGWGVGDIEAEAAMRGQVHQLLIFMYKDLMTVHGLSTSSEYEWLV